MKKLMAILLAVCLMLPMAAMAEELTIDDVIPVLKEMYGEDSLVTCSDGVLVMIIPYDLLMSPPAVPEGFPEDFNIWNLFEKSVLIGIRDGHAYLGAYIVNGQEEADPLLSMMFLQDNMGLGTTGGETTAD